MADRADTTTALSSDPVDLVHGRVGSVLRGNRDGRGLEVALACAEFNGGVTSRLLDGALAALSSCGVGRDDITVAWVPGAFELPLAAAALARSGRADAVICLGAVIRGETGHYDFVAGECAHGLSRVQADTGVPVVFGVLTTDHAEQALDRSRPGDGGEGWEPNKGWEAAMTGVEMARLLRAPWFTARSPRVGPGVGSAGLPSSGPFSASWRSPGTG